MDKAAKFDLIILALFMVIAFVSIYEYGKTRQAGSNIFGISVMAIFGIIVTVLALLSALTY